MPLHNDFLSGFGSAAIHGGDRSVCNGANRTTNYSTANMQMRHPVTMLNFELKDHLLGGKNFIDKLQLCVGAVSQGTCDTRLSHPAPMTDFGVQKKKEKNIELLPDLKE